MRTAIIRAEISRFIDAHYREDISMQDAAAALRYSDTTTSVTSVASAR